MGSALLRKVEGMQAHAVDVLSLREEVEILSVMFGDAIATFSKVCEHVENKAVGIHEAMGMLASGRDQLYHAANQLRDMKLAAKRLEENGKSIDITLMGTAITQIIETVDEHLLQHEQPLMMAGVSVMDMMDNIAKACRDKLLVIDQIPKTVLTAERLDNEVQTMIDTVPEVA